MFRKVGVCADEAEVSAGEPAAAVAHDVAVLRDERRFADVRVSGLGYDVETVVTP